jgi:hypothetical protein
MSAMAIRNSNVPQFRNADYKRKEARSLRASGQSDYALFVLLGGDLSPVIAKK